MPHRVATFIRNSTTSFENQVSQVIHLKKANIRSRSRTKSPHGRRIADGSATGSTERVASYASSVDDDMDEPSPMSDAHTSHPHSPALPAAHRNSSDSPRLRPRLLDGHDSKDHHHHRLSFPGLHHLGRSHHSKDAHKEPHANAHAEVSWKIESPPIIFHGDPENSTGALVSGLLYLDIKDDAGYEIDTFTATLHIRVTQKKPFAAHCPDCASQFTQLKEWTFLSHPGVPLHKGRHTFPFSVLLDGHLPATLESPLVNIAYEFKAEAIPAAASAPQHQQAVSSLKLEKTLDVKRSLPPPELPHHSVRVFPPTNVKASVHYPQIIHPIGSNTLTMRLDGIARLSSQGAAGSAADTTTNSSSRATVEYWKLKKLTWRLEETLKTIAPACDKHKPAAAAATDNTDQQQQQQRAGVARTETRVIGEKTLFSGWKSSYAGPTDSHIELELDYWLNAAHKHGLPSHTHHPGPSGFSCCDLQSAEGTAVSHQLMLELVVSQECAPAGKPAMTTQTGVGRILRMHFGVVLTERGGIGISWDNEAPPIYQDVPPSPPAYNDGVGAMDGLPDFMESLDGAPGPSGYASGNASGRSSGRNSAEGFR